MTITAEIDVTRPAGRKLVQDLEKMKVVELHYPQIKKNEITYSHEEVFRSAEKIMNDYFGTNIELNL